MKENVTSQKQLLEVAKRILLEEGIDALSIRRLTKECHISVGVFYNYFTSKSDLIFTLVSNFWQDLMKSLCFDHYDGICEFIENLYKALVNKLEEFEEVWLLQISLLDSTEKQKGKELEQRCFSHMVKEITCIMEKDQNISDQCFSELLTKDTIAHFILMNVITLARNRCQDCSCFIEILKRVIYE